MQITLISRPLRLIVTLLKILRSNQNLILERLDKIMADFTAFDAEALALGASIDTTLKNLADHIGEEDPAIQAGIDSRTGVLTSLAAKVKAADPGPVA